MATRKVTLEGISNWARVFEENRDMEGFEGAFREFDGAYTIDLDMDKTNFQKLKDAGSIKKGKDGNLGTIVKLVRKHTDRFEWASGAPKVYGPSGLEWDYSTDGVIPNGSTVECEVSVYDTARPSIKGTRLDAIKVVDINNDNEESEEGMPF